MYVSEFWVVHCDKCGYSASVPVEYMLYPDEDYEVAGGTMLDRVYRLVAEHRGIEHARDSEL